jgi:hypothetical protein
VRKSYYKKIADIGAFSPIILNTSNNYFGTMSKLAILLVIIALAISQGTLCSEEINQEPLQLEGASILKLPNTSIQFMSSSYSFQTIHYLQDNQGLAGQVRGLSTMGEIFLFPLSFAQPRPISLKHRIIAPDKSGNMSFSLGNVPDGAYIMLAKERKQSAPLAIVPLIVQKKLSISAPERLSLGNFLVVKLQAEDDANYTMGAILMPLRDYNLTSISIAENLTISREEISVNLNKPSPKALMDLLPIIPEQGTLAIEPQAGNQSTLSLITDAKWQKGQYILLCAAYGQKGISIAQKFIELV